MTPCAVLARRRAREAGRAFARLDTAREEARTSYLWRGNPFAAEALASLAYHAERLDGAARWWNG